MKILFIQLPLLDHGLNYIDGNHQYAPALLSCYVRKKFVTVQTEYLHAGIINILSDNMIISYILKTKPDIVSFSTYLWNAERNLFIAQAIKAKNSSIVVLFGGPEINEESFLFYNNIPYVDFFIKGEGEWFFDVFINNGNAEEYSIEINGNKIIQQPADALVQLDDAFEPYTNNFLDRSDDGSVFLEMTRGCPYKCSYCYYSKNAPRIREYSFNVLLKAIHSSKKRNLTDIYILSPTFNKTKDFCSKLDILSSLKHGLSLHTEMRPDSITEEIAEKIFNAGFQSLEVGLQTLTEKALKRIGRVSESEKSLQGIENLLQAGIDVKAGIIPGLPGDSVEEFLHTIQILQQKDLGQCIEFYPLMILPGTKMREIADAEGILYQKYPPYFVIQSGDFTLKDIKSFLHYIEDLTGFSSTVKRMPDFTSNSSSGFIHGISVNSSKIFKTLEFDALVETSVFSVFISGKCSNSIVIYWIDLLYSSEQKFTLFHLILQNNYFIDEYIIEERIQSKESDTFYSRIHLYDENRYCNKVSIIQVFDDTDLYVESCMQYDFIEPILKISRINYHHFLSYEFSFVPRILVLVGAYRFIKEYLSTMTEYTDYISFENEDEKKIFYNDNNLEYKLSSIEARIVDYC